MQVHASVLYIIADQIHRLGLSKQSVKSLVGKAKKADSPEKKTEVISKLNAIADAVWKKFLTLDVSKMSKTSAEDDSSPVLLSHKLLALYFFQAHTHQLTTTPIAQYISLARRSSTTAAQEKLIQVANELAREIYTRYRKRFPAAPDKKKSTPAKPSPKSPAKARVKQVVEKIQEVKETKVEDLKAVEETISQTPQTTSNVVTLAMLRERAKTLKVDISDLGRKKSEIINRLREAEAAAHAPTPRAKARKPEKLIPKEIEVDDSLSPEPAQELPTREIMTFSNKNTAEITESLKYIDIEKLTRDINLAVSARLPRKKTIPYDIHPHKEMVRVYYPNTLIDTDQSLLREALSTIGGNLSGGLSNSRQFFGIENSHIFGKYGIKLNIAEKLSEIPTPNSVEALIITWENISESLSILENYTNSVRSPADFDLIIQWRRNMFKIVFGTTDDQKKEKVEEFVSLVDPEASVSARVAFNGQPSYVLVSKMSQIHKNLLTYAITGDSSKTDAVVGEMLSDTKLVKYDSPLHLFKEAKKLKTTIENLNTSVKSALEIDPSEYFSLRSIKGESEVTVYLSRKGYHDDKVKDRAVYPKLKEINRLVLKAFTAMGYKIVSDRLLRENSVTQGATRGLKQMVERINALSEEDFSIDDVYSSENKEYIIVSPT